MSAGKSKHAFTIIYRAFYVVLMLCIAVLGFGKQLGLVEITARDVCWMCTLLAGLLGLSFCRVRGKLLGGILAVLLFCLIPMLVGVEQAGEFWLHYGNWLIGGNSWETAWYAGYELVQCGVIVIVGYLLQALMERVLWLRDIAAVVLVGNLVACMYFEKDMGQAAVSATLWYAILAFVEWTERVWKKKKGDRHKEYVLRILPFCAIYLWLMCVMPTPEEPYDWQIVKDAYHNIYAKMNVWMQELGVNTKEDFGMAYKGFSEDGRLMGGLIGEEKHLLTVKGSTGLKTNVYLVGKVYDTFDGTGWTRNVTEDTGARLMDTLETLYAVRRYDGELMENYVFSTGLTVEYQYFHTGYLFAPLKMYRADGIDYQYSGSNLMFEEQKGYGTKYKLVYYQLNVDHPKFYQMAETELQEDAGLWEDIVEDYVPGESNEISLEDLQQYRRQERAAYQGEMVLSERVAHYLEEITAGAETDVEKLRAIEKALSGLSYTENPGALPEEVTDAGAFLDYFLLESKQGYCSYFATAFVLLARAEGIPARYVEGFCVPVNAARNMAVTSSMAHAWPEVYLEDVGWIPFEPTPGYSELRYTPWVLKSANTNSTSRETELEEEESAVEAERMQAEELLAEELAAKQEESRFRRIFLLMSGMIAAGCIVILLLDRVLFYRKYKRMTPERKFETEVKRNLWLWARLGFVRDGEETLAELRERIQTVFPADTIAYYENYLYGDCRVTDELLQAVTEERRELFVRLKQKKKWHYYLLAARFTIAKIDR